MTPEQQLRDQHAAALIARTVEITDGATAAAVLRSLPVPYPANRPTVVCLCGSTRFWDDLAEASLRETAVGKPGYQKLWNGPPSHEDPRTSLGSQSA